MTRLLALGLMLVMGCCGPTAAQAAKNKPPPPPTGEIVLDMDNPFVTAVVNGVILRLRVGLEQKDVVELNPDVVARLGIPFEPGFDADVGRTTLKGIAATGALEIDGRPVIALLSSHGRDCCTGVDGAIGAAILPYATVRFVRSGVSAAAETLETLEMPIDIDEEHGLQVPVQQGRERIYVQFSLGRPDSVATSSAGAILATAHRGRFVGGESETVAAFGIRRPSRMVAFDQPFSLAGFVFDRLPARMADFAGHYEFPAEKAEPGDIVVKRRTTQQPPWPVVLIGSDRLDRCSEILLSPLTHLITLRCAFAEASH